MCKKLVKAFNPSGVIAGPSFFATGLEVPTNSRGLWGKAALSGALVGEERVRVKLFELQSPADL